MCSPGMQGRVAAHGDTAVSCDSQRIGQGRENAKQFLRDHQDVADAIEKRVREQSGVVANAMLSTLEEAEEAEAAE